MRGPAAGFAAERRSVPSSDTPSDTRRKSMTSARPTDVVIVSAVRTPIATAYKGSLDRRRRRSRSPRSPSARPSSAPGSPPTRSRTWASASPSRAAATSAVTPPSRLGLTNLPGVATQRWCASGMAGTAVGRGQHRRRHDRRRPRRWRRVDVDRSVVVEAGRDGHAPALAVARQPRHARTPRRSTRRSRVRRQRRPPRRRHPCRRRRVGLRVAPPRRAGHRRGPLQERDRAGDAARTAPSSSSTSTRAATPPSRSSPRCRCSTPTTTAR